MNNNNDPPVDLSGLNRDDLLQLVAVQQSHIRNLQHHQVHHQQQPRQQQQQQQQQPLPWLGGGGGGQAQQRLSASTSLFPSGSLGGGVAPPASSTAAPTAGSAAANVASLVSGLLGVPSTTTSHFSTRQQQVTADEVLADLLGQNAGVLQQQQQGQDPLVSTLAQLLGQQVQAPAPTVPALNTATTTTNASAESAEEMLLRSLISGGGASQQQQAAAATLLSQHILQSPAAAAAQHQQGGNLDPPGGAVNTTNSTTARASRIPEVSSLPFPGSSSAAEGMLLTSFLAGGGPPQQHQEAASLLTHHLVSDVRRVQEQQRLPHQMNNTKMAPTAEKKKTPVATATAASAAPVATITATATSTTTKKKTKRPLSAYNIFFKEEHAKIIAQKEKEKAEQLARGETLVSSDDDYSVEEDEQGNKTGRKRKRSLSTNQPGKRGKRQVDFENLTKVIGRRWKELPKERINEYRKRAEQAMQAYRKELFQKIRNSVKEDQNC